MTQERDADRAIAIRLWVFHSSLLLCFTVMVGLSCYQRRCHDSEFTCEEWCSNKPDIDSCDAGGGAVTEECDECGDQTCLSWQVCCTCEVEDTGEEQWDLSGCGDAEYVNG